MAFDWITALCTSMGFTAFIAAIMAIYFLTEYESVKAAFCGTAFICCISVLAGILGGA